MTFEVGVKLQTGERFEIEAVGDETVADLKNRIEVSFFNQNSLGTNQKIRTRVPTTQYFVLVEKHQFYLQCIICVKIRSKRSKRTCIADFGQKLT